MLLKCCTDSFTFTFSDPLGPGNAATVFIDVYNNAPVATDASYSVLHDATLTGQVYGYDPDGDAITAHLVNGPSHGTVTLDADGTFTYTPNPGYVGHDSFAFSWTDGLNSSEGMVWIDVYNNVPVADEHNFVISSGDSMYAYVSAYDPDGDEIAFQLLSWPEYVHMEEDGSPAFTWASDGSFTYMPRQGYVGTDSFVFGVADRVGQVNGNYVPVRVNIHVEPVHPVTVEDRYVIDRRSYSSGQTVYQVRLNNGVLSNDLLDPGANAAASVVELSPGLNGRLSLSQTGEFQYHLSPGYVGGEWFTYAISDGYNTSNTAVVELLVNNGMQAMPDAIELASLPRTQEGWYLLSAEEGLLRNDYIGADTEIVGVELLASDPALYNLVVQQDTDGKITGLGLVIRAYDPLEVIGQHVRYRLTYTVGGQTYVSEANVFLTDSIVENLKRHLQEYGDTYIDIAEAIGKAYAQYLMGETAEALAEGATLFVKLFYDLVYMRRAEAIAARVLEKINIVSLWDSYQSDEFSGVSNIRQMNIVLNDQEKRATALVFQINLKEEEDRLKTELFRLFQNKFGNVPHTVEKVELKFAVTLRRIPDGPIANTGKGLEALISPVLVAHVTIKNKPLKLVKWGPTYFAEGEFSDGPTGIGHQNVYMHEYKELKALNALTTLLFKKGKEKGN